MEIAMLGKGVLREACLLPRPKPHVLAGEGWCPLASIVGWGVSWMLSVLGPTAKDRLLCSGLGHLLKSTGGQRSQYERLFTGGDGLGFANPS